MPYRVTMGTSAIKKWATVLAVVGMAGTVIVSAGRADQADAKRLLKAMSDYLGAQKAISFDYDVSLELVSTQQQQIALASSGTVTLNRPDKLHLTRTGGFASVEMVFDGKTLTLLGKNSCPFLYGWCAHRNSIRHTLLRYLAEWDRWNHVTDLVLFPCGRETDSLLEGSRYLGYSGDKSARDLATGSALGLKRNRRSRLSSRQRPNGSPGCASGARLWPPRRPFPLPDSVIDAPPGRLGCEHKIGIYVSS